MSNPDVINAQAAFQGEHQEFRVRGYEQAFPTEGHTSQGIRFWKSNLIEMKRIAKQDGLDYRKPRTRRRRK